MNEWSSIDSEKLYGLRDWGENHFGINKAGNVFVRVYGDKELDLQELIHSLVAGGIEVPILLRFEGVFQERVKALRKAFDGAMEGLRYESSYEPVLPIKVSPIRPAVEAIIREGRNSRLGLEVGSKPELIAVLGLSAEPGTLLLCNGYKDREYIELALIARKLGWRSIVILEHRYELELLLDVASKVSIEPEIGIRVRPASKGSGKWQSSSGTTAKFGLNTSEILSTLEALRQRRLENSLVLLHFHAGSQMTSILAIQELMQETSRLYAEMAKICPSLEMFDIGGGLAVDYEGACTDSNFSMNYTQGEYARDVVYAISAACRNSGVQVPKILSESGRALTAHHGVLVTEVIATTSSAEAGESLAQAPTKHHLLCDVQEFYAKATSSTCMEMFNDAMHLQRELRQSFLQGSLSLSERAYAESALGQLLAKIRDAAFSLDRTPPEIVRLNDQLVDTYFCNFSLFRSLPDSWAIGQIFPVVPLGNLHTRPNRRAVLADMSCDSDGMIDRFASRTGLSGSLPVHKPTAKEPYYLGIFLVGAYQEIMGGSHNLFGDTNVVHVQIDAHGQPHFVDATEGDTIREVLSNVRFDPEKLIAEFQTGIDRGIAGGTILPDDGKRYRESYWAALEGYTYLSRQRHTEHSGTRT